VNRSARLLPLLATLAVILAACAEPGPSIDPSAPALTQPDWPAPADPMAASETAGTAPGTNEYLTTHTHAHLDVFVDGLRIEIPAAIGIDINGSGIVEEDEPDGSVAYFLRSTCDAPCLAELHTHSADAIIHTESAEENADPFTLGQFFTSWGVELSETCVGEFCSPDVPISIYTNGNRQSGDPTEIELESHLVIAIVIGKPPATIPSEWIWGEEP
jgi:hypothetical protein